MGEIAAWAQDNFYSISETRCGEDLRHNVVPGGACAGEQDRRTLKSIFAGEASHDLHRPLQECANGILLFQNALIHLHPAQGDRTIPAGQGQQHGLQLFLVSHARPAAPDA